METKFNFNSAICTSRSQSERLLALGLKKETADMCWTKVGTKSRTFYVPELAPINMVSWRHTPAWSLHRLILLLFENKCYMCDHILFSIYETNAFTEIINHIEWLIKEGYFNKEYLWNEMNKCGKP